MLKIPDNKVLSAKDFALWLDGFLDSKDELTPVFVERVREKLNAVFIHEIDPSMPDPNGQLQRIHDGEEEPRNHNPNPRNVIMKC